MSVIPMQRITILALKKDAHRCTHALLASRLFQPLEEQGQRNQDRQEPSAASLDQSDLIAMYTELERDLLRLLDRFGIPPVTQAAGKPNPAWDCIRIRRAVEEVSTWLANYDREHGRLLNQFLERERAVVTQQSLAAKGLSPETLSRAERLLIRVGWIPENVLSQLRETLGNTSYLLDTLASLGQQMLLLTMGLPRDAVRIDGALLGVGFQPQGYAEMPSPDQLDDMAMYRLREQITRQTEEYAEFQLAWTQRLLKYAARVKMNLLLLESEKFSRAMGPAVFFEGWVPVPDAETVEERIRQATKGRFWIKREPAEKVFAESGERERVPILHRNPLLLQPFQRLVGAYGDPAYSEIDPTPVFAITFILMFGMMFGDVGQGALLSAAGYGIFRRLFAWRDIGILLMECGASSMVFGVLYGNVFGIEHTVIPPLWFHPMENIPYFLNVALILGMVLLSVGFIFNMINAVRRGAYAEAIFGKHGLTAAFLYWILAGVTVRYALMENAGPMMNAWLVGIIALLLLLLFMHVPLLRWFEGQRPIFPRPILSHFLESAIELVDTVARFLGNTVSFLRVAAFALVHAGLFLAIFTIATMLAEATGGTLWYWLTVALGNLIVIVIEGLIVSIQILRLEYYEFFSKFYQGTGQRFRPMGT